MNLLGLTWIAAAARTLLLGAAGTLHFMLMVGGILFYLDLWGGVQSKIFLCLLPPFIGLWTLGPLYWLCWLSLRLRGKR
jgi:hypothetical protein